MSSLDILICVIITKPTWKFLVQYRIGLEFQRFFFLNLQQSFRVNAPRDPAVAVMVFLHNHGSLTPNLSRVYGSDFAALFMNENDEFLSYFYEVSRVNLTELNSETNSCSKELDDIGGDPGLVLGENGLKTVDRCILDFYHENLKCQLPWSKYGILCINFTSTYLYKLYFQNFCLIISRNPENTGFKKSLFWPFWVKQPDLTKY